MSNNNNNNNKILIEINRNIMTMRTLCEEVEGSYNPYKLNGHSPTEIENFNKTIKNINRALKDMGKFLESNSLFSG